MYHAHMNRSSLTLLETVHGSHLYGLARPESDLDTYRVVMNEPEASKVLKLKTKQSLSGKDDVLETSLSAFMMKCSEGVPQALEAMFSTVATVDEMHHYRKSYYLNTPSFARTYRRTLFNFARLGVEDHEAMEVLAPSNMEEATKERVRESYRLGSKPRRVERNGLLKYRKHSVRLLLNLEEGLREGRFNPTLSPAEVDTVLGVSALPDLDFARFVSERAAR